jgi:hypothetical protein
VRHGGPAAGYPLAESKTPVPAGPDSTSTGVEYRLSAELHTARAGAFTYRASMRVEISSAFRGYLEHPLLADIVIALQLTHVHCFNICTVRQAKSISDLVSALCYAVEEEKYQAAKKERLEVEGLAREAERLRGERDRISMEESYTAEEEKILSEQAGEMELAIAAQAGSAIERRDSVKALKGVALLNCSDRRIQCFFVLHLLPVDSVMEKLI